MRCDVDPDEVSARQPHDDEGVEPGLLRHHPAPL
jgi:hypothetical protein